MQNILFTRVDTRVMSAIRKHMKQCGKTEFFVTHEQLAGEINSSREVVSRILKRMEHEGIIQLGRGKITVLDINKLMEI